MMALCKLMLGPRSSEEPRSPARPPRHHTEQPRLDEGGRRAGTGGYQRPLPAGEKMSLLAQALRTEGGRVLGPRGSCVCGAVLASTFHRQLPKTSGRPPAPEDKEGEAAAAAEGAEALLRLSRHPSRPRARSLREMPGPKTFSNLLELFWRDGFGRIHELQQKHVQEYGKIFKSHFGPKLVVSIADRDMVAQVLREEGSTPQRADMDSWQEYRNLRGRATGLISAEGEEWLKMRRILRQKMVKPKDVAVFSGGINDVIADLVKRIHILRNQEEDGETVTNVNSLFF